MADPSGAGDAGPTGGDPAEVPPPRKPPGAAAAFDRVLAGPKSIGVPLVFGVLAPPVLLSAERWVGGGVIDEVLPLRPFTSSLAWASVPVLAAWLVARNRAPGWMSAAFAGALAAAACGALGIGVLMLPMTLLGLLIGIGVLGFVPFVTSWVFFGATVAALGRAIARTPLPRVVLLALAGGCTLLAGSWAGARLALRIEYAWTCQLLWDEHAPDRRYVTGLRALWWVPGTNLEDLGTQYALARDREDSAAADRLSEIYTEITGRTLLRDR